MTATARDDRRLARRTATVARGRLRQLMRIEEKAKKVFSVSKGKKGVHLMSVYNNRERDRRQKGIKEAKNEISPFPLIFDRLGWGGSVAGDRTVKH